MIQPPKLTIRLYGDPCLREKSQKLTNIGPGERMLVNAMIDAMHEHKGIGLAAPQVGINQRIFVADIGEGPHVFINPKIIKKEGAAIVEEGCLSIPEIGIEVQRAEKILIQYQDEDGNKHERSFEELLARVIQHENDHLDGKLIVDYASEKEMTKFQKQLDLLKEKGQVD